MIVPGKDIKDIPPLLKKTDIDLFQPNPDDIVGNDFNPPYRFVFENVPLNEKEIEALDQIKKEDIFKSLDTVYWNDGMLLRFIQGCYFNLPKSVQAIENHDNWRKKTLFSYISSDSLILLVVLSEKWCCLYYRKR